MTRLPTPASFSFATAVVVATSTVWAGPFSAAPSNRSSRAQSDPLALNVTAHSRGHRLGAEPHLNGEQVVSVQAEHFQPAERVQVRLSGTPTATTTVAADAHGRVTYTLNTADQPAGAGVLAFVGQGSGTSAASDGGNIVVSVPDHAAFGFTITRPRH